MRRLPTVKILCLHFKTKVVGLPLFSGEKMVKFCNEIEKWENYFVPQKVTKILEIWGKCCKMFGYIDEGLEQRKVKK